MPTDTQEVTSFILITTSIIFLLALIVMTLIYRYQRKNFHFQRNIDSMRNQFEKNLLQTQIEIQEQTFKNVSREIHDNVSLSLTLAKLNLNTIDWNTPGIAESSVKDSIGLISSSIADLSDISKSMNADLINSMGLIKVLENEVERVKRITRLHIEFNVSGETVFLDSERELVIYRIIQEGLNNTIQHSKATHIILSLSYETDMVRISLKDNGVGFDKDYVLDHKGTRAGLSNIETRAKMFEGQVVLDSICNKGTELKVTLPINKSLT